MISSPCSSHTRKPNMGHERIDIGQPDPTFTEDWLPYRSVIRYAIGGGWGNETLETGTGTVRIIRGTDFKNIHNGNLQGVPLRYETSRKISSRQLEDGDVILEISGGSRTSNQFTGRSFFVSQNLIDLLGGVVIPASFCRLVRFDEDRVAPKYAYYALQNMYLTGRAALYEQQSTGISNFQFEYFLDEEILRVPPLPEQQRIAGIFGALDDKIELNRRMNETLEQMARALYKSWFVDFDPVRAKMDGWWRPGESLPGLPATLYDLFPDRLVESEIGEVPEEWMVGVLTDMVQLFGGGTPKTSVAGYWNGNIPWYTPKDAPVLSDVFVIDTERQISQDGVDNSSTQILPAGTTVISARGTVGRLACLGEPMAMNQTCYGVRGTDEYPDFFTYWNLRRAISDLQMRTHGTIFDTITRQTFELVNSVIPPSVLAAAFETMVSPYMKRMLDNLQDSRRVGYLRDALLPRLITGELRVSETNVTELV